MRDVARVFRVDVHADPRDERDDPDGERGALEPPTAVFWGGRARALGAGALDFHGLAKERRALRRPLHAHVLLELLGLTRGALDADPAAVGGVADRRAELAGVEPEPVLGADV